MWVRSVLLASVLVLGLAGAAAAQAPNCYIVTNDMMSEAKRRGATVIEGKVAAAFMTEFNAIPPASSLKAEMVGYVPTENGGILAYANHEGGRLVACILGVKADGQLQALIKKYFVNTIRPRSFDVPREQNIR